MKDLNNVMIVHTPAVVANAEPPKIDEGDLAAGVAGVVVLAWRKMGKRKWF